MGQSQSKNRVDVLKCPSGYNSDDFQKICVLFDKLDKDSNLGVSSDELDDIARLHVENCKLRLKGRKAALETDSSRELAKIEADMEQQIILLKLDAISKKNRVVANQDNKIKIVSEQLEWYSNLDEHGKCKAFMEVVSTGNNQVDFQAFFEYMKNRTGDITNINYK